MIDLSLFFTPTIQGAKPQSALSAPVALQDEGIAAFNFMDMFLAGLQSDAKDKSGEQKQALSSVVLTPQANDKGKTAEFSDVQTLLDSLSQDQIDQHGDPLFSLPPEILAVLKNDVIVDDADGQSPQTGVVDWLQHIAARETIQDVPVKNKTLFVPAGTIETPHVSQQFTQQIPPFESLPKDTQNKIVAAIDKVFRSLLTGTPEKENVAHSLNAASLLIDKKPIKKLDDQDAVAFIAQFFAAPKPTDGEQKIVSNPIALPVVKTDGTAIVVDHQKPPSDSLITLPKTESGTQAPLLIAANVTPQQLNNVIKQIVQKIVGMTPPKQEDKNVSLLQPIADTDTNDVKVDEKTATDPLLATLVQLIAPPQEKPEVLTGNIGRSLTLELSPQNIPQPIKPTNASSAPQTPQQMDELASTLNDLVVGASDETDINNQEKSPLRGFARVLEVLEKAGEKTNDLPTRGLENAFDRIKTHVIDQSQLQKSNNAAQQSLQTSMLQQTVTTSDITTTPQPVGLTLMPLNGAAPSANLTLQAPQAGTPHPATQMVAATIAKNAQSGETKAMTLHLDPPELGRLQIKMEFGRDKTVKTHLIVEKPETFAMLQRDAFVLERTLQQSGLNVDNGSVSFELSQGGGNLFDHSDRNQGSGNTYGGGETDSFDDDGTDIIQTTVNWQVDPTTGQTRYELWA